MGDHRARSSPTGRYGHGRALAVGLLTAVVCLSVAGAAPNRGPAPVGRIAGAADLVPPTGPSWQPRPVTERGLRTLAAARNGAFALRTASGDKRFLPGVNLGSTTPGHQPGELAMDADDYRSWFDAMGRLGIRTIRIYTIHPPAFYTELAAYNRARPNRPLYLLHGVYPPDETYLAKGDLYDRAVTDAFSAELRDAAAAAAGQLTRPPAPGRADGSWRTDVRDWLVGWLVGLEWDPNAVHASDRRNAAAPAVAGRYFRSTPTASPTERWLAARLDELAGHQAARGDSTPIGFVNWPTTDPLRHPEEPLASEDLVGIDANNVRPTDAWPGGTFASYHAYPYYPDFQRHEPALQTFQYGGRADPYAGYLDHLRRHHADLPVLITEFGVPSSLGSAHHGPLGRSQGGHSERDAMRIDAQLLRLIHDLGLAGGLVFAWTDEWFKLTWNTINHQQPAERRQLWHDPLTNEQHFGLLATDPVGAPDAGPVTLLDQPTGRPARRITARVDEAYLHLRITLAEPTVDQLTVGLDVLAELTGSAPPGSADPRPDAALVLDLGRRTGQAWLRDELDPLPLDYPVPDRLRPVARNGWRPLQLVVNRELTVPSTGRKLPTELFDAGQLRYGSWDPADPRADSRALWHRAGDDLVVRVPWAVAGFADPSSRQVLVPTRVDGVPTATTRQTPGVVVGVAAAGTDQRAGELRWAGWNRVYHAERFKQGIDVLRDAFVALGG